MPFSATRDLWLVLKARDEGTRALKSFSRDVRLVGDSVRQANLQAARSALQQHQAMQRLTGATEEELIATQRRIGAVDREINQGRIARASMEETRVAAQRMSSALSGVSAASGAVGTGLVAASVFGVFGLKNLINAAVDYQKESSLTRTQVEKFALSLKDVEAIGLRVAAAVGVSFDQIQPALYDIFSSMEVNGQEAEDLLKTFSKAAVAGQTSIQSASRATIGILNAFHLPLSKVNHLMDLQFQLVQEGVGTYEEWTQRIGLVTPSAARAGQSVETMLAALAATTRMGVSAARAGTAVARAMDAMSNPNTVKNLAAFGVKAVDAKGKFRPLIDVLTEFRTQLMKLPEADRAKKVIDIFKGSGGTIEARRFLQNMLLLPGNIEMFKSIFDEMSKESGSFEEAYSIMADTTATKSELLNNKWQTVKVTAGEILIPAFMKVVDWAGRVLDWFNQLNPATQKFIVLFIGAAVILAGIVGVLLLVISGITALAAAVVVVGPVLLAVIAIVTILTGGLTLLAAAFAIAYANSGDFRDRVNNAFDSIKKFYDTYLKPTWDDIKSAFENTIVPAFDKAKKYIEEKLIPALNHLWDIIKNKIWASAVEIGNTIKDFVITSFHQLADVVNTNVMPTLIALDSFYKTHKQTIDIIVSATIQWVKWILKLIVILGGALLIILTGPVMKAITGFIDGIILVVMMIVQMVTEFKRMLGMLKAGWKVLTDFFGGDKPKELGHMIIQGIISGLEDTKKDLLNYIGGLGTTVINKFKSILGISSPSKVFKQIGAYSMQGFILGFQGAASGAKAQIMNTTAGFVGGAATGAGSGGGRTINNHITVNTQELDPRRQSAELGWYLAGSM